MVVLSISFFLTTATSQDEQKKVLKKLEDGELQGIIATDIAGEGLDIPNCSCAIRYKCVGNEISSRQFKGNVTVYHSFF